MALFDAKAETYDDFCVTPLGSFVESTERQMIGDLARPMRGERALDLGCGTGAYARWLLQEGLTVVGVDISAGMLDAARRKTPAGATFVQADLLHLPFDSGQFDLALCNVVLEFAPSPAGVLREALRVLKPGGRLVAGLIGGNGPWARKYAERGRADASSVYRYAHFFSYAEATRLAGIEFPDETRFGLYVGPDEFRDAASAAQLEVSRRAAQTESGAGFMVLRWNVG